MIASLLFAAGVVIGASAATFGGIASGDVTGAGAERAGPPGEGAEPPVAILTRAVLAYRQGSYGQALELFRDFLAAQPRDATAHYYVAACQAHLGHPRLAVESLRRAVEHGYPRPESLREDAEFRAVRSHPGFAQGLGALLEEVRLRRERGIIARPRPVLLGSGEGEERELSTEHLRGRIVVVAFLDSDQPASLETAFRLEELRLAAAERDRKPAVALLGIVRCAGKGLEDRRRALEVFRERTSLTFPLIPERRELLDQLRPFHEFPTVLFVDARGLARRVVEGVVENPSARYEEALAAVRKPRPSSRPATGAGTPGRSRERKKRGDS